MAIYALLATENIFLAFTVFKAMVDNKPNWAGKSLLRILAHFLLFFVFVHYKLSYAEETSRVYLV